MNKSLENTLLSKWGKYSCSLGFTAIPTMLFFAQRELNISSTELNILLNIFIHWWDKTDKPFPAQGAIAYRTGLSVKTVQRALSDLEEKGLIIKTPTPRSNKKTKGKNLYNLMPLVEKLNEISPRILHGLKERKNMIEYERISSEEETRIKIVETLPKLVVKRTPTR